MRFDALEPALDALQSSVDDLAGATKANPSRTELRRYTPEQQVTARLELSGPQRRLPTVHAGVDVHGDGSTEPYLGRIRRRPVDHSAGEGAVAALRRALSQEDSASPS
jgi:hypothetical protein